MSKNSPITPQIVSLGAAPVIRAFGSELIVHLTGEQTAGRLMLATIIQPAGGGPPPHWHENEDEYFLVQEGRFRFLLDRKWIDAEPGTAVFAPRGLVHTLHNVGETTGRVLVTATPSGFEIFFARCAEEFAKPGGPDMARIVAISAEHGIKYAEA